MLTASHLGTSSDSISQQTDQALMCAVHLLQLGRAAPQALLGGKGLACMSQDCPGCLDTAPLLRSSTLYLQTMSPRDDRRERGVWTMQPNSSRQ